MANKAKEVDVLTRFFHVIDCIPVKRGDRTMIFTINSDDEVENEIDEEQEQKYKRGKKRKQSPK